MNNYIEKVFNNLVPDNKGYTFIGTENIFVPIYRVTLTITKRKQTRLNLVEEMVLRIANCGVTDLDEICGILGLSRDIVDITIGDLFVKSFAYPSSNKCFLMSEGRNILKQLVASKKETDTIRHIYVNALNKEIYKDKINNIIERCMNDDCKVRHTFDGRNIEFYRSRVSDIKVIFNRENEIYASNNNQIPDELVSIDDVEDINVCFLKIPTIIYISETGTDIDLISSDNNLRDLLDSIKGDILDQIRKHKLLKKIFIKYGVKEVAVPTGNFMEMDELKNLIKKYVADKNNQDIYHRLIIERVLSDRILIDNELEKLFEFCVESSSKITFYVDNLDYWSKNSKFITLLTLVPIKTEYLICYNDVSNMDLAKKRLNLAIPELSTDKIKQHCHSNWFTIIFDDRLQIIGCPQNYRAIDSNTLIIKCKYYLQTLN
jgi:hypothetical protein